MGWIETTDEGREVEHDWLLVAGSRVVPGEALDSWLLSSKGGAAIRSGCTCGWRSTATGPLLPQFSRVRPRRVLPWLVNALRTVLYTLAAVSKPTVRVVPPNLPAPVRAWSDYHFRVWQTHLAAVVPNTTADEPYVVAERATFALLHHVEQFNQALPTLSYLRRVEEAVEAARLLAVSAAEREGHDRVTINFVSGVHRRPQPPALATQPRRRSGSAGQSR
ncbi:MULTISPECIES: hypothetical protein [unclassified Crossiella]|uniref:hypothetical protein n=1 Tax=unclassified Crossiella TaxID=2620835 RepID=UPI001FFFC149|nr:MULTISPECIES: hypothetical protein [unclassified Crossiella]MCK2240909.1 hypothetical protein [Crossiella sp. S99.2]MCK2253947.1 hypothetical protein [Crossiella sp. S99.1]